jgi:WD40 repeat protein
MALLRAELEDNALPAPDVPKVPGYQVLEVLGKGGMGVVYKARQTALHRLVALKMIRAGPHADPEELVRFLAEAEAVAALQHPNVVQIHEIGNYAGLPFFSLEFVEGGSLAERLHGAPQQPRAAARIVEQVACAMEVAHQRGLVHRDLKPSNILLALPPGASAAPEGPEEPELGDLVPKVADFGLVHRVAGGGMTQTGAIVGTPSYMAPEQAGGTRDIGPPTDVWALGAILYECLTGRPPFRGLTPLDTVFQVLNELPVPPARLQPGCPRDLETICLKCLQKDPNRRYACAGELGEDLRRFLADRPVLARRTGAAERAWRWCRRNPIVATMTTVVVVLLIVLAVGGAVAAVVFDRQRRAAEQNLARAVAAEDDVQEKLWQQLLARARAGRFSQRAGQRFDSLAALSQAAQLARQRGMSAERLHLLRNETIACLALPDVVVREWDGWPEGSEGLAWSAERGWYARGDAQGNVSVRRLDDDGEVAQLAGDGARVQLDFQAAGKVLVIHELTGKHRVRVWRPAEDTPVTDIPEAALVTQVAVAPAGDRVAVGRKAGGVLLYDLAGKKRTCWLWAPGDVSELRFSPDGRWLGVGRLGDGAAVYELRPVEGEKQKPIADMLQYAVKPVRSDWYLTGPHKEYRFWFSPDGRRLALRLGSYGHGDANTNILHIYDLEKKVKEGELGHPRPVSSASWHPNSKLLATGTSEDSLLTIWDVASRKQVHTTSQFRGGWIETNFNATGDLLVTFSSWQGGMKVWHAGTAQVLLSAPDGRMSSADQARDGRLVHVEPVGRKLHCTEVHPSREYRVLALDLTRSRETQHRGAILHPGGRLVAGAAAEGLGLWDLDWGDPIGLLPGDLNAFLFDVAGNLFIMGPGRLERWPVRADPAAPHRLRVGPPQPLPHAPWPFGLAISRDGKVVLTATDRNRGTLLVHTDHLDKPVWLEPQYDARYVAVSPDGRWAVTGSHFTDPRSPKSGLKAWDAATGKLAAHLPFPAPIGGCFMPDGSRYAVTRAGGLTFLEVGTWRETGRLDGNFLAFSPDGRTVALRQEDGSLTLVEVASGRELIRLEAPGQVRHSSAAFSSDGTQLLFASYDTSSVHVWDLGALRHRLAGMGLDWSDEPLPPVRELPATRLEVTVDLGGDKPAR